MGTPTEVGVQRPQDPLPRRAHGLCGPRFDPTGPALLPVFFNHDIAQAQQSLALIADLAADVVVPGHGPVFRGTPARAVASALAAISRGRGTG